MAQNIFKKTETKDVFTENSAIRDKKLKEEKTKYSKRPEKRNQRGNNKLKVDVRNESKVVTKCQALTVCNS